MIAAVLLYWINMVLSLPLSFYSMNKLIGTRYSGDFESNAVISSLQIHVNYSNNILKVWRPEKMIPRRKPIVPMNYPSKKDSKYRGIRNLFDADIPKLS